MDNIAQIDELNRRYQIEVPDVPDPSRQKTQSEPVLPVKVPNPPSVDPGTVEPGQQSAPGQPQTEFELHDHNGKNSKPVSIRNLVDFYEVLSATPTHVAKSAWDQIKIVNNAGTRELWVYDYLTADWHQI